MMFGGLFGFGRMTLAPDAGMGTYGYTGRGYNQGNGYGPGMMGGNGGGMMGGNGGGMTLAPDASAGVGGNGYQSNLKPLSIEQAKQAVEKYLLALNNPDLKIDEIMIFSNNAYARIIEKSTNVGAFELLVDPSTLEVFPEYGPNMMWNLKYGGLTHQGMMGGAGGMMGMMNRAGVDGTPASVSAEMPVKAEQALKAAQDYLDANFKGAVTAEKADPFYGYYTIDILRDGKISGMLGVNGYNGQVFFHSWHGDFIEMAEE
jgi:hypothetical protein